MKNAILFSLLAILPVRAIALNSREADPSILDYPDLRVKVHNVSNIRFTISNFAQFGNASGWDDPDDGGLAPGAEYPARSGKEYLFGGALWIGAEVDTIDENGNPTLDTLVSIGMDGWINISSEMYPTPGDDHSLWEERNIGDQEFFAVYTDTLTDPIYIPTDPYDQRPHIPLGVKVIQHSMCWSSPGFNEIFIIEYLLENVGGRDLHNVWLGFYYDGDVWHDSENLFGPEQGAMDDLTGFLENGTRGIAWLADNNGQPYDGQFEERSPNDVAGMMLLGHEGQGLETNFNWWISNTNIELDWGPQLQSNFDIWGPFLSGGRGNPAGDKAKYQVMSNGEHDYDMIWAALDHTGEGWIPSVENVNDIANGFDARYLISFGPLQIPPGASDTLTIAFFGGRNLHTDPLNYENYLRYNVEDSLSIAEYYGNLDFSDLIEKVDTALSIYSDGYAHIPLGPPHEFHIEQWSSHEISLGWEYYPRQNLLEYRIYRGTEPGVYDPEKITPDGFIDSVFVDSTIGDNTTYYYVIASTSTFNTQGGFSPEVFENSGRPQTPGGLTASSRDVRINLSWDVNPDSDLYGYIIYRADPNQEFAAIDTVEENSYIDTNVLVGREYRYKIEAIDVFGNVSYPSEIISVFAVGLDYGILLVMMNNQTQNPDYDSMTVFYERLVDGYQHMTIDYDPYSMPLLASFSTVVFAVDHLLGERYFDIDDGDGMIADYLDAGGNILLAGSRLVTPTRSFVGRREFQPNEFLNRYLNIAEIHFPDIYNTEFEGGNAETALFDDFPVDTLRAQRIQFPPVDEDGRLPGVGTIIPKDTGEVIYSYVSAYPDSSDFHGDPIGIIHHTENYSAAVLEFPIYYIPEPLSFELMDRVFSELGEVRVDAEDDTELLPKSVQLSQNFPNPFNSSTTIRFYLPRTTPASVTIYNILGRQVGLLENRMLEAGEHSVKWSARDCPSGIYFARLSTGEINKTVKMILLK